MNIFINYRRADSQYQVDRLYDELSAYLEDAEQQLYLDTERAPLGQNYVKDIEKNIIAADVFLAVIGDEWLEIKDTNSNETRLQNPDDLVRQEIAAALKRDIPVIPTLLDEAKFPASSALPNDIAALALRNGVLIKRRTFKEDVHILAEGLGLTGDNRKKGVYFLPPLLGGNVVQGGKITQENRLESQSSDPSQILSANKNVKRAATAKKGIAPLLGKIVAGAVLVGGVVYAAITLPPDPPPPPPVRSLTIEVSPESYDTTKVDDRLNFEVTIRNTGEVQESEIVLSSENLRSGSIITTEKAYLNPGETFSEAKVYRVQEGDLSAGKVDFRLSATSSQVKDAKPQSFQVMEVKPADIWSPWYDNDRPSGDGDFEMLSGMIERGQGCEAPTKIECRTVSGKDDWTQTGQVYVCTTTDGGYCRNAQQPDYSNNNRVPCLNYESRVLCPAE